MIKNDLTPVRWLINHCSLLRLVVAETQALINFEWARASLRLQLCRCLCAFRTCCRLRFLILLKFSKDSATGPLPNHEVSRVTA